MTMVKHLHQVIRFFVKLRRGDENDRPRRFCRYVAKVTDEPRQKMGVDLYRAIEVVDFDGTVRLVALPELLDLVP